jgi:hypothetical protein
MVASVFKHYRVLSTAPANTIDYYNSWFKAYGLWDFVEDLIAPEQLRSDEVDVEIEGGVGAKLTAHNLSEVLSLL